MISNSVACQQNVTKKFENSVGFSTNHSEKVKIVTTQESCVL